MKDYISERAVRIANYIIQNNATVRQTAQSFGVSKSTVHKLRIIKIYDHTIL
ncbi:MAG: sporulation transcriptional regulator SpoIIID, partial [Lachnospiraceae bacterium]|nr:sporulation transcriptional regulator SpoIIID [Lachnospiraceae bacterium]